MSVQGRVGRLTALAIATGTLVAAGTGVAGASTTATPTHQLTATGKGAALHLVINLPTAIADALHTPTIEQYISLTDGKISTVGLPTAETTALLGQGDTPVLSDLLNKSTKASLGGKTDDSSEASAPLNQPGFSVQLLPLSSKVANPATTLSGTVAKSSSAVAHIAIGGLPLTQLNAVTAPVQQVLGTALGTASGTADQTTGTVTNAVNSALSALNGVTQNSSGAAVSQTVQNQVNSAVATLNGAVNGLTSTLTNLKADANLVSLDAITSDQAITRNGSAMTSTVANTVKNLNVLNGLVKIAAITSQASATAGGAPGTAKAVTNAPVFKVDVANGALTALLDQNGLNVGGTVGSALPPDVQGAVNTALDTVNSTLNQAAGIHVEIGQGATQTAPDGTSAVAKVAATRITVDPPALHGLAGVPAMLPADKKFLTLELVSAEAVVGNAAVAPQIVPAALPKSLPRTGGSLPLTGGLATVLLGAALVVRRRRTASIG